MWYHVYMYVIDYIHVYTYVVVHAYVRMCVNCNMYMLILYIANSKISVQKMFWRCTSFTPAKRKYSQITMYEMWRKRVSIYKYLSTFIYIHLFIYFIVTSSCCLVVVVDIQCVLTVSLICVTWNWFLMVSRTSIC